jgi:hypothetical protein
MAGPAYLATMQWIWCDIDGSGRCWRLAVERDDGMVYFPVEDFEEHGEVFENYPSVEVESPESLPEVRCKFCKQPRPATEDWIRYHQDEPVCKNCWDERLRVTG